MRFAAINGCTVDVKCYRLLPSGRFEGTQILRKFSFTPDKAASETHGMLKTAFGDCHRENTRRSSTLLQNAEKFWLKIMGDQVVRPQITETIKWRKFAEL